MSSPPPLFRLFFFRVGDPIRLGFRFSASPPPPSARFRSERIFFGVASTAFLPRSFGCRFDFFLFQGPEFSGRCCRRFPFSLFVIPEQSSPPLFSPSAACSSPPFPPLRCFFLRTRASRPLPLSNTSTGFFFSWLFFVRRCGCPPFLSCRLLYWLI